MAALIQGKKLTLKYFGIPALGEPLRILLTLGDFNWDDVRVRSCRIFLRKYTEILLITSVSPSFSPTFE